MRWSAARQVQFVLNADGEVDCLKVFGREFLRMKSIV